MQEARGAVGANATSGSWLNNPRTRVNRSLSVACSFPAAFRISRLAARHPGHFERPLVVPGIVCCGEMRWRRLSLVAVDSAINRTEILLTTEFQPSRLA